MIDDNKLLNIYKLSNVVRYNNKTRLKDENVAEHSFYVAMLSLIICDTLNIDMTTKCKCLEYALLHDMPEIELNDISHDVKNKLNLRSLLLNFENDYYKRNFNDYLSLMNIEKTNIIYKIVKLADVLSVKQYCLRELQLGNTSFNDILEDAIERTDKLINDIKEAL